MNLINWTAIVVCIIGVLSTATIQAKEAQSVGQDYRINPEDILDISVWKEPDLEKTVTVRPDGGITVPLVGEVNAAGLTTQELQSMLRLKLSEYMPDPVLTVTVNEIRGLKIYLSGQVARPGEYLLGRYVDVFQAITLAGGPTPFADKKNIRIIRRDGSQSKVLKFNYAQVERGKKLEQNILLFPGDTVVVP